MSLNVSIQIVAALSTLGLLLCAGINDVRRYRIPNRLVIGICVAFGAYAICNASWSMLGTSLAAFGIALGVGAFLFSARMLGGGDVKLISAMALWTSLPGLPRFLLVMTAIGGLLAMAWLVRKHFKLGRRGEREVTAPSEPGHGSAVSATPAQNRLPYGVAIAAAGIDFLTLNHNSPIYGLLLA